MTNPISGHTAGVGFSATSLGLRDGDGLTSASLTNIYEGLHGNGIIRLQAGAATDALRNSIITGTPGYVEVGPSGNSYVKVSGGYCVLDGVLYEFAGGDGAVEEFQIGVSSNYSGTLPTPPSNTSDVYVVIYLRGNSGTEQHLMYEMGTPVQVTQGTPLLPSTFLSKPSSNADSNFNEQTTVLAILRYTMTASQASIQASLQAEPVVNDRRTYVRAPPIYLTSLTKGTTGNVTDGNNVDSASILDNKFTSPEVGDFNGSTFGAIWQTHNEGDNTDDTAAHAMLLYAAPRNLHSTPATHTHRLGPDQMSAILTTGKTFLFDQANIFLVNPNGGTADATLTPSGTFPPGHVIEIRNISTSGSYDVKFTAKTNNAGAAPVDVANGKYAKFVYDGTDWHLLFLQA